MLRGIEQSGIMDEIELSVAYPAELARQLKEGSIDMALMPVAAMRGIPGARIVSDYGIAADGPVASVCIYSQVPMEQIGAVYLDYQSRTSVKLAQILMAKLWKRAVTWKPAPENYIEYINDTTAGVIIGDRALKQLHNFNYVFDLAAGWKELTGLPFVFAAWISNKDLPADFLERFNEANRLGLEKIDEVVAANPFPYYDLKKYYTENIHYFLDDNKKKGLALFLEYLAEEVS